MLSTTPTAPPPTANVFGAVTLGSTYIHPSGVFQIDPPAGWTLSHSTSTDWSGRDVYSAVWINEAERIVVHAFVVRFEEMVTLEAALAYVEGEFASGLANYDAYEVTQMLTGDPIIVEFALSYQGLNSRARQWVTIAEDVLQYLRIVVPEERAPMLDQLASAILPTYRAYPAYVGARATATPSTSVTGAAGITISNIGGVGNLEEEFVELNNTDGTVNLEGWTLCGEGDDNCYTFPRFVLFPRGTVAIYTRAGDDTPVALFWDRDAPVWQAGETIMLRDAEGNVQAERVVE